LFYVLKITYLWGKTLVKPDNFQLGRIL